MSIDLQNKITERQTVVGVIGLGYVGLPLAVEFAGAGHRVIGFDVDTPRTEVINSGVSYIPDVPTESVKALVEKGSLSATSDFSQLVETDVVIICVPTPLRKTKEPDISYILAAAEQVAAHLHSPQLIILESTTYPGTTDEVLLPMLEATGLKLDEDFFLAFSPERVDPGNKDFQTHNIPKVVGGVSVVSMEMAAALYQTIVERVHKVSSARVAETAKLLENTFRSVNIALVNEMAQLCYHLNIDSWEVIQAAATKPFGFMAFYPGPGIGGHCLVGEETVIVRSNNDKNGRVEMLEKMFAKEIAGDKTRKFKVDNADVIYKPGFEALSIDTETQQPIWKPVHYLFRRAYEGPLFTVTTSDNRKLTVTDKHPMLVCDTDGDLQQVFAKDLVVGDCIPVQRFAAAAAINTKIDRVEISGNPINVSIKSIEIKVTEQPVNVYSVEVDDTHTFATSYGIYVHNCIPLDPHYLSWKARLHGFEARFISLAEEVNSYMPRHVVKLAQDGLNEHGKPIKGSRILILGVAYKRDIDDVRESPALGIAEQLLDKGANLTYHDPYIAQMRLDGKGTLKNSELTDESLSNCDCVLIVTDHTGIDYEKVVRLAPLVIDTRNATRKLNLSEHEAKIIRL
jgi:UDP-N-acetyl-D-mannosaminuronate dehydrogenase